MEINLRGNLGGCRPIHARSYAPKAKGAERQRERKGYEAGWQNANTVELTPQSACRWRTRKALGGSPYARSKPRKIPSSGNVLSSKRVAADPDGNYRLKLLFTYLPILFA
jgi:hypothetical protein